MTIQISQPLCYSSLGQKPNQEDAVFPVKGKATKASRVFMVCDGMGGHEHGEVASACVADTIGSFTAQQPLNTTSEMKLAFEQGLLRAYQRLDELDHNTTRRKMGTTLTFLALCTDGVLVAHIGDSRVYQYRPEKGLIFQTRDHSLVNDLIASGDLNEDDARTFPQRNVITRAVQPHQEYPAKATFSVLTDIRKGDLFLLCCDGVVEQIDNDALTCLLHGQQNMEERIQAIRKECAKRNTNDNNTAYLIEVTAIVENLGTKQTSTPTNKEKSGVCSAGSKRCNAKSFNCCKTFWSVICIITIAGMLAAFFYLTIHKHQQQITNRSTEEAYASENRNNASHHTWNLGIKSW